MTRHQPIHMFIEDALKYYIKRESDVEQASLQIGVAFAIAAAQEDGTICHSSNQSVEQTHNFDHAMLDCAANCPKKVRALITIAEHSLETQSFLDRLEIAYSGKRLTMKRITHPDHANSAVKLLKARVARRKKLAQPT
jgi:hypothetical protein